MKVLDVLKAQDLGEMSLSYFDADEYNNLPKDRCVVSATTKKYGTFRFSVSIYNPLEYIKLFVDNYIKEEIEGGCGVVKFKGVYIYIPDEAN